MKESPPFVQVFLRQPLKLLWWVDYQFHRFPRYVWGSRFLCDYMDRYLWETEDEDAF